MALLAGSPAIDAGDNTDTTDWDQRGLSRIVNDTIDIGAFEVQNDGPRPGGADQPGAKPPYLGVVLLVTSQVDAIPLSALQLYGVCERDAQRVEVDVRRQPEREPAPMTSVGLAGAAGACSSGG